MGVGTRFVCRMRLCQMFVGSLPMEVEGRVSSGDWEKLGAESAISSSPEDIAMSWGLPGSDTMEDWSSLSYFGFKWAFCKAICDIIGAVGVLRTESCGQELLSPDPGRAFYGLC